MKQRYLWIALGFAFVITLAVVVGQRLSSEAMAVMIGVIAGVAASIPTSLIVVWFAARTQSLWRASAETPASRVADEPAPRIVVMAPPGMGFSQAGATAANQLPAPAVGSYGGAAALPQREFTVIGGADVVLEGADQMPEVLWQR